MNCKKETEKIEEFISKTFKEKGFSKAVIGISGGLDSAVVATLLCRSLERDNVEGILLPYGEQHDLKDCDILIDWLHLENHYTDIKKNVDELYGECFCHNKFKENNRLGNIKARIRMIYLYDYSNLFNALVVGTGNKTELMLGYYTLHGDGACALEPIGHLYKTEVFKLAKYLNIPKEIINKPPSAGLWEGQTDEKELGITYKEIDNCLKVWYDNVRGEIPNHIVTLITERVEKNKFKTERPKMIKNSITKKLYIPGITKPQKSSRKPTPPTIGR